MITGYERRIVLSREFKVCSFSCLTVSISIRTIIINKRFARVSIKDELPRRIVPISRNNGKILNRIAKRLIFRHFCLETFVSGIQPGRVVEKQGSLITKLNRDSSFRVDRNDVFPLADSRHHFRCRDAADCLNRLTDSKLVG